MQRYEYDVIVLGGGPGGSTLATLVAMQGHKVLLLERERFPRYQIGESLLPTTVHGICAMLGVTAELEQACFPIKRGGMFLWGKNPRPWDVAFDNSPSLRELGFTTAYQVERMKFDTILLENAKRKGVRVLEEHTVLDLIMDEREKRVAGARFTDAQGRECTATARYVVDALGHRSHLYSKAGERIYSKHFQNAALHCYYTNGKRFPPPRDGNILSAAFPYGWFWYIPLSSTLTSVGAVIAREHFDKLQQDHEEAMEGFISACPAIQDLLADATRVTEGVYGRFRVRKDYSYCNTRFWVPGFALIGDAACFIDPLFSSGVHLATYSALLAARAINTCLRERLDEGRSFDEFERRYRLAYDQFRDLLMNLYDACEQEDSYFWTAKKILGAPSAETPSQSFVRLVSGLATAEQDFEPAAGSGQRVEADGKFREALHAYLHATESEKRQISQQARLGEVSDPDRPLFEGGLIPSRDGFHWCEPERFSAV
jgi:halogenation protein CepH